MKQKINYLGFLSLLALIAILGWLTENKGLYGFFGFAYYFRYFRVIPDEFFRLNVQKAATFAFMSEMISLVPFFAKAVENDIEENMMGDWLVDFFGSHSEEYDIAAGNGSAKNSNITTRHNVLSESFEQFFSEV